MISTNRINLLWYSYYHCHVLTYYYYCNGRAYFSMIRNIVSTSTFGTAHVNILQYTYHYISCSMTLDYSITGMYFTMLIPPVWKNYRNFKANTKCLLQKQVLLLRSLWRTNLPIKELLVLIRTLTIYVPIRVNSLQYIEQGLSGRH